MTRRPRGTRRTRAAARDVPTSRPAELALLHAQVQLELVEEPPGPVLDARRVGRVRGVGPGEPCRLLEDPVRPAGPRPGAAAPRSSVAGVAERVPRPCPPSRPTRRTAARRGRRAPSRRAGRPRRRAARASRPPRRRGARAATARGSQPNASDRLQVARAGGLEHLGRGESAGLGETRLARRHGARRARSGPSARTGSGCRWPRPAAPRVPRRDRRAPSRRSRSPRTRRCASLDAARRAAARGRSASTPASSRSASRSRPSSTWRASARHGTLRPPASSEGLGEQQRQRDRLAARAAAQHGLAEERGAALPEAEDAEDVVTPLVARVQDGLGDARGQREEVADDQHRRHGVDLLDARHGLGPRPRTCDAAQDDAVLGLTEVEVGRADAVGQRRGSRAPPRSRGSGRPGCRWRPRRPARRMRSSSAASASRASSQDARLERAVPADAGAPRGAAGASAAPAPCCPCRRGSRG